jgi:hypothetical protein
MQMLTPVLALFGGGAAAAGTAGAAAGAASTGLSIASVLQGVATVGGLVAAIASGNAESTAAKLQAQDAEQQKTFETVQAVDRHRNLLAAAQDATGQIDAAYAGSGVDLSFGSAAKARERVYRQTDMGTTTDNATTDMRLARLTEQAANFRASAKAAKRLGWITGLSGAAGSLASIKELR